MRAKGSLVMRSVLCAGVARSATATAANGLAALAAAVALATGAIPPACGADATLRSAHSADAFVRRSGTSSPAKAEAASAAKAGSEPTSLPSTSWLAYGNGPNRRNYTPEKFTTPLSLVWKFTTAPADERVPPVVTADRVFCPAGSHMYCLDLATGASLWDYDAGGSILAAPSYADGRVFFGADNGRIVCLNAADGKQAWLVSATRSVRAAPAVVGGVVYVALLDRRAMAIDAASGAVRWTVQLTDELWGAPAVAGDVVYVPTADAQLFGLDTANGRIRMQLTMARRRALLRPPVVAEDAIYITGRSDLHAFSRRGSQRWEKEYDTLLTGAPAFDGRRLYVSLIDGRVLAVDPQRGQTLWQFDFNNPMASPPTAVGEVVIAGSASGMVYALDAATGQPRWRYEGRPPGLAAGSKADFNLVAPAVYSNGSLYLIWDDGSLARFDANAPDATAPTIRLLTPAENMTTGTKLPKVIGAQVYDEESGLDVSSLTMKLDGAPIKADYNPYAGYYAYTIKEKGSTGPLKPGWHTLSVTARDRRGNEALRTWRFVAQPGTEAVAPAEPQPAPAEPTPAPPSASPESGQPEQPGPPPESAPLLRPESPAPGPETPAPPEAPSP